ncbi:MAG: TraR/DksA C4-type zinc finger protein [Pirellulales bacterium]
MRLHYRLVAQRDDLRKKLTDAAVAVDSGAGTSNLGDVANDDAERDVNTQLASFESRELIKIERAIRAIREGRYGKCDTCGKAIPVERLRALPYTSHCVTCQRLQEHNGDADDLEADWESAYDYQARQNTQELSLSDFPMDG